MADAAMLATAVLAALNAILAAGLLAVYARTFSKVRARFTAGLMVFATFFVAQNVLALYAYVSMMDLVPPSLGPYLLFVMVFEAVGLGVMLASSNK